MSIIHLLKDWNKIKKIIANKYLVLFLDFDGTLAPIAKSPEKAFLDSKVRKLLKKINNLKMCSINIISGRTLENIRKKIGINNINYIGNHGLEIKGPKISFRDSVDAEYKTALQEIYRELKEKLKHIKGVVLEDKKLTLSIHYRLVSSKYISNLKKIIKNILSKYYKNNNIIIRNGKKVVEIRPEIALHKGDAALWVLSRLSFMRKNKNIIALYFGDDTTDEDAFKVLKKIGITVFVGLPKKTCANYYLNTTTEVKNTLEKIYNLKK